MLLTAWQEAACYLRRIRDLWSELLGSELDVQCLDAETVRSLSSLMPAYSAADEDVIRNKFHRGEVFATVRDLALRRDLLMRVLRCTRIITLDSFFQDLMFLEACHDVLRQLWNVRERHDYRTFRDTLRSHFEGEMVEFPTRYINLWLEAMRVAPFVSDRSYACLRKDKGKPLPERRTKDVSKMAELARKSNGLGFANPRTHGSPTSSQQQVDCTPSTPRPLYSCSEHALAIRARANRPFEGSFFRDRDHWTFKNLFGIHEWTREKHATTLAVARDIVHCFWGDMEVIHSYTSVDDSSLSDFEGLSPRPSGTTKGLDARLRPASSTYDDTSRLPSSSGSARFRLTGSWSDLYGPGESGRSRSVNIHPVPAHTESPSTKIDGQKVVLLTARVAVDAARRAVPNEAASLFYVYYPDLPLVGGLIGSREGSVLMYSHVQRDAFYHDLQQILDRTGTAEEASAFSYVATYRDEMFPLSVLRGDVWQSLACQGVAGFVIAFRRHVASSQNGWS